MKVLHIVENLHRGAVENWLIRMLRHARQRSVALDWTFYCAMGAQERRTTRPARSAHAWFIRRLRFENSQLRSCALRTRIAARKV